MENKNERWLPEQDVIALLERYGLTKEELRERERERKRWE